MLQIIVPNKLNIKDCAIYLAYFLGKVDDSLQQIKFPHTTVGIRYDYADNSLTLFYTGYGLYECTSTQEMMLYDRTLPIPYNIKMMSARMFGCYVANDRMVAVNEAPTMLVDYRFDRCD